MGTVQGRQLILVATPDVSFVLELEEDEVVKAENAFGYMKGWSREHVVEHCARRGWIARLL